jgi:hypothetical protein
VAAWDCGALPDGQVAAPQGRGGQPVGRAGQDVFPILEKICGPTEVSEARARLRAPTPRRRLTKTGRDVSQARHQGLLAWIAVLQQKKRDQSAQSPNTAAHSCRRPTDLPAGGHEDCIRAITERDPDSLVVAPPGCPADYARRCVTRRGSVREHRLNNYAWRSPSNRPDVGITGYRRRLLDDNAYYPVYLPFRDATSPWLFSGAGDSACQRPEYSQVAAHRQDGLALPATPSA